MGKALNPLEFGKHVLFDKILDRGGDSGSKTNMRPTNRRLDRLIAGQGLKPVGKTARKSGGTLISGGGGY